MSSKAATWGLIEQRISIKIKFGKVETRIGKFENKSILAKSVRYIAQDI